MSATRPHMPGEGMKSETRTQYGFRRGDGQIHWYHVDHYGNGISTKGAALKAIGQFQEDYRAKTGQTIPVELVKREFIATTWGRWTGTQRTGEVVR